MGWNNEGGQWGNDKKEISWESTEPQIHKGMVPMNWQWYQFKGYRHHCKGSQKKMKHKLQAPISAMNLRWIPMVEATLDWLKKQTGGSYVPQLSLLPLSHAHVQGRGHHNGLDYSWPIGSWLQLTHWLLITADPLHNCESCKMNYLWISLSNTSTCLALSFLNLLKEESSYLVFTTEILFFSVFFFLCNFIF